MTISEIHLLFLQCSSVSTDTRRIETNCIFFCLKGENFNANDFALSALELGAKYVVCDESRQEFKNHDQIIQVDDSLRALQELASYHRSTLKTQIFALTGSNGKTTTKELLLAALSSEKKCIATQGNLNNHIGVPLTLLRIKSEHEIAIVEMGANHQQEIAFLCDIAKPDMGLIINIGLAHLEGFGGAEGVYLGKKELFDYLVKRKKKLFINNDDPKVKRAAGAYDGTTFGASHNSLYSGNILSNDQGFLMVEWLSPIDSPIVISTQITGEYNFSNVMAAIAVSHWLGVSPENIVKGIESYTPTNHRSQVIKSTRGNTLIVDCYNANPSSMHAAIHNLISQSHAHKFVILGDMRELGSASPDEHQKIVSLIEAHQLPGILVGPQFGSLKSNLMQFATTGEAKQYLNTVGIRDHQVLVKGSRGLKLEELLDEI